MRKDLRLYYNMRMHEAGFKAGTLKHNEFQSKDEIDVYVEKLIDNLERALNHKKNAYRKRGGDV